MINDLEGKRRIFNPSWHELTNRIILFTDNCVLCFVQFSLGMGSSVDLSAVATVTRGLCGADLEFIVNEAAIRAVRRVSSKLREGIDPSSIVPTVTAEDFERSVADFFEMRKPKGGVGDFFSNVLG